MKRKLLIAAGAVGLVGAGVAIACEAFAKYEEPEFTTVSRDEDNIEIRRYSKRVVAEVEVDGTGDSAANEAFRILAGYIFGKNQSQSKIPMTVPVTEKIDSEKIPMTTPVAMTTGSGRMTMRFFMPSSYSLESLPVSLDKRISFSTLPTETYAVIRFSGSTSDSNMLKHEDELAKFVKGKGLNVKGQAQRAVYNPPWTLPFMRRNEVWIPIEDPD